MEGPLKGIRVLDLTSVVMGPYCTLMLGDMGADVIKIEPPTGDTTRYLGPSNSGELGSLFLHLNRSKRSVVLDLKSEEGRNAILKLAEQADIIVHTMRPASMKRLKLAYADFKAVNERIIYCGMYGFSEDGPYAGRPAYDDIIQAASGMASAQGKINGQPQYLATVLADKTTGLIGLSSVLAALYQREVSGIGQEIEVPMFESMVGYTMTEHLYGKTYNPPLGDSYYSRVVSPYRKPYQTTDGYIGVMIYNDKHWKNFIEVSGREDLVGDERFVDINARTANIDFVYQTVEDIIRTKSTDEWLSILKSADIPCTNINTPEDLRQDPHLNAVNFFNEKEHPAEGTVVDMKFPVKFSLTPTASERLAPGLGEHTDEVLNGIREGIKRD
ncbi:Crotonobetainyl-CoA:carnitine CoA-transferase CaiB [Bhargavaea ginsengi]|uniref:Crotonobetainyl-CoA:carnitine CoA-transferase CaiB n=1 Tax=Bhargavaea ginsengi TaxID=426757 RepID=A0A1H6UQX0_9BACL|nr:CoA transferase [Bhargavaea ginsengi]SEI90660.1 Crotonobetainyl-CoA:carnitine CoA-transferase CaiB [Bhargavaea ginsengi]